MSGTIPNKIDHLYTRTFMNFPTAKNEIPFYMRTAKIQKFCGTNLVPISGSSWGWHASCDLPRTSRPYAFSIPSLQPVTILCLPFTANWKLAICRLMYQCSIGLEFYSTKPYILHIIKNHLQNWKLDTQMWAYLCTLLF